MGITIREKDIILSIIESDQNSAITINAIAEKLNVSSRTVLRTIPYIEKFLKANGFKFSKKPGVGLILNEDKEGKKKLLELVNQQFLIEDYTPKQRGLFILCELLLSKEPIKLYYFTSKLSVSEGTLSKDLDKLLSWIEEKNLKLIRKQGVGIYIEGDEERIRQSISSLVYEFVDEEQIIDIIKEKISFDRKDKNKLELDIKNRLLSLIDKETIKIIEKYVSELELEEDLYLADSAYIALIVHLSLAVQRIKNQENIEFNKDALEELKSLSQFDIATKLAKKISKAFNINIPEGEIGYITMHLKGAKLNLSSVKNSYRDIGEFSISKIAVEIIKIAEIETAFPLSKDKKLEQDLINHLGPAVSRLKMNLVIRNPLVDTIKTQYKDIYQVSKKCCKILKNIAVGNIPESEISYIAMHIAAAIERIKNNMTKTRVIVACGSGIGTSRLLSANLLILYPNIEIVDTVSYFDINKEELEEKEIDLIISTIALDIKFPHITVSPMLTGKDKEKISAQLELLSKEYKERKIQVATKEITSGNYSDVLEIVEYGNTIKKFIDSFQVYEEWEASDVYKLIDKASILFSNSDKECADMSKGLKNREKLGSTFIEDMGISLLHCTLDNIDTIKFGLIRVKKKLKDIKGLEVAIVIVIPKKKNSILRKVVSEFSEALVQDEVLIETLKYKGKDSILNHMQGIYTEFYYKTIDNIREQNKKKN